LEKNGPHLGKLDSESLRERLHKIILEFKLRKTSFIFLVFIHNLVFSLLVILSSFHQSFLASTGGALIYWIAGWLIIFRERKLAEMPDKDNKKSSSG
jgi:hypothetical protein